MNSLPRSLQENNRFLSAKIKKYINDNLNKFKNIKFTDRQNDVEIYKVGEKAISELEEARFAYEQVYKLSKSANNTDKRPIKCYIYLVDVPKELDLKKDNITTTECNSGCTTYYEEYIEIAIWRKEEWLKVFYHELVHAFNLDKLLVQRDYIKEMKLKQLFPHYNNSIYEAYSEILATILFINRKERLDTKPKSSVGFSMSTIKNSLNSLDLAKAISGLKKFKDQNLFLGAQVNKIIYFISQKSNSSSSFLENPNSNKSVTSNNIIEFFKNPKRLLDDSTNTSSYYILKSVYLWTSIYKDSSLLFVDKLLDKEFIKNHFYDIFINALESNEYYEWLNKIFFIPKNNSLKLTL